MDIKKILFRTSSIDVEKALPDALVLCTKEGKIEWVNDAAAEIFETSKMHLLTSKISDFIENPINLINSSIALHKPVITKFIGKETYFDMTVKEIEEGYVLDFRDAVNIQNLNESDSEIDTNKNRFLLKLANDLKSPIFSQINALNMLLKDKSIEFSDAQRELLGNILTSNIYMRDMVLNMLTNFRMKNTSLKLKISTNSIENTIDFCIKSIEPALFENNQTLIVKNKCKSPYAEFDEIEIKRVVTNLLSNAIKYGKMGTKILLEIEDKNGNLKISVTNKGKIGFKNTDDVFKLYKTRSKENSKCGSGLGLYISKQIIDAHLGKIKAQSLTNEQVKFSFEIPIISTIQ